MKCVCVCVQKAWDEANERAKELVAASKGKCGLCFRSANFPLYFSFLVQTHVSSTHLTILTSGEDSGDHSTTLMFLLSYREGHASLVTEVQQQLQGIKPDLFVLAVGGGGLMNGVLEGLHHIGWEDVPVVAMETQGAHSFAACVQANAWVELNEITRQVWVWLKCMVGV